MGKRRKKSGKDPQKPIETELRLAGDPEMLQAIFVSPCLMSKPEAEETVSDLENRYFDTPTFDLRARGLAFRVRANGKGYRQTLKSGDDAKAALQKRGEWETVLDDQHPRPQALPKPAREHLPEVAFADDGLCEAFTTRVHRRTRKVSVPGDGIVEAAFDLGAINSTGDDVPIAEIELELLQGEPEALYRLALELQEIGSFHLETRSKSTRAFDHLAKQPPNAHRGTTPTLKASDSVDEVMAAIFESCFQQWLANQAAAIDGRDPEGVHQMRVGLRRLRSALSVFRKLIPADQLAWLQPAAKEAIGALGPARDWDVFQAELLAPVIAARPDDADLRALATRVRARVRSGYRQAKRHLESANYTRFVLRFGQWLEQRAWRQGDDARHADQLAQPIAGFAGRLLDKRQKQALAKGRQFADLPTAERHQLRITLKKLRYSVEFFRPLFDKTAVKPFLNRTKALQEDLGLLNDVAVAEGLLADLLRRPGKQDIRAAAGVVIGWHAHAVVAAEPALRRDWKAFVDAPTFWGSAGRGRRKSSS